MENKKKTVLRAYFRWPFLLGAILALAGVIILFFSWKQGLIVLGIAAVYFVIALAVYGLSRQDITRKTVDFGASFGRVQDQMLKDSKIPFVICNADGEIFWSNPVFKELFAENPNEKLLARIFPHLENANFAKGNPFHVTFSERNYCVTATPVDKSLAKNLSEICDVAEFVFFNLCFEDETDLLNYKRTVEAEKSVFGLVYFDNYDEAMNSIEEVRRSLLSALLERKLAQYAIRMGGLSKRLEKDRYLIVMKQESLWKMEEDKFSLLEDIKTVSIGNEMPVTLSMGIGMGGENYERNFEYAQAAIDMALGRGGDQAVLKNAGEVNYYGGKTQNSERSTRVRSRIKANALREIIENKDTLLIMGHPISDFDCLGAAIGISCAARYSGKKAHIIMEDSVGSVRSLMETFRSNPEYDADFFISREQAIAMVDKNTLVVVVDTNRPSYTQCPEILEKTTNVVVMDHHRQGRERIENALLSYVEPYASSASEMVSEMVQYYADGLKLRPQEADAVYAGIVMDTNNFEDKAGVRTFEAAAFLRRCGADITRVRKLFRDSMEDYMLRAETIRSAEVYKENYIIGVCPSEQNNPNQTVVAAQAANELLEIRGVKASFVFTLYENKVYLSARSIDEINVQIIAEKLGGGGHLSIAGAQFDGITVEEAIGKLKAVLEET